MNDPSLLAQLGQSAIYREYERAFVAATGMPLALRPVNSCRVVNHGKPGENPLCVSVSASVAAVAGVSIAIH